MWFRGVAASMGLCFNLGAVLKGHPDIDFSDDILSSEWRESELENDDLKNYKAKAEFYVRQHMDDAVIAKLRSNTPLTAADVQALEKILWHEIGTQQDYEAEYGHKPLGEFVREIVGMDMNAAKEAFAVFLNDADLDSRQIYFVNQIVEYSVHNGLMTDAIRADLEKLRDFRFSSHPQHPISENRLSLLDSLVRHQLERILE